ncbi:hypothetical protein ACVXHB_30925 [Escherichia coli]
MERTKNRVLVKGLISPAVCWCTPPCWVLLALCCCGLARIRWPAGWG